MRTVNRILALLLGLGLAGAAGLGALEAVQLHRGEPAVVVPRGVWDRGLSNLRWGDGDLRTAATILVVVGAVLLLAQLAPRRAVRLPLRSTAGRPTWISRHSLDRLLVDAARRDPEVLAATAKTARRRASVQVTAARSVDRDQLRRRVSAALAEQVSAIEPERPLDVHVRARHAEERAS